MSPLQHAKMFVVQHLSLAKDALHIYVGLLLFLLSAAAFRWPLRSWKPWLVVLAVAFIGEAWDLRDSLVYDTPIKLAGNWQDIWNTMFWPTALFLIARHTKILSRK
jgi:hypothetical protein